eukprot:CAMPEP_0174839174 /NCGR_PEP_ID=MMETSP1114-20130205/7869_1 /TAXON_ID=312471 /ORGANISM="Neobodo designis, Strain CCAP 1951/1" /LENGTH=301 /DNA_ID=CAMNT_0016073295 /DNA_START=189 /DNA_END=1091 /DNA_ORIENTATION=+
MALGAAPASCPTPPVDALANVLRHLADPHTDAVAFAARGDATWTAASLLGDSMPVLPLDGVRDGGFGAALAVREAHDSDESHDDDDAAPSRAIRPSDAESAVVVVCAALGDVAASCTITAWDRAAEPAALDAVAAALADGQHKSQRAGAPAAVSGAHAFFVEFGGAGAAAAAEHAHEEGLETEDDVTSESTVADDGNDDDDASAGTVSTELRVRGAAVGTVELACAGAPGDRLTITIQVQCNAAQAPAKGGRAGATCNRKLEGAYSLSVPRALASAQWAPTAAPIRTGAAVDGLVALLWPL